MLNCRCIQTKFNVYEIMIKMVLWEYKQVVFFNHYSWKEEFSVFPNFEEIYNN